MDTKARVIGAVGLALLVSACGITDSERISGDAATGAATGAAVGALAGPVGIVAGAAIGGVTGGVTGDVTEPETVNLGQPPWSNPNVNLPGSKSR